MRLPTAIAIIKKPALTMEVMIPDLDYADQLFTPTELQTTRERLEAPEQMFPC